jgi:hypothetical protein
MSERPGSSEDVSPSSSGSSGSSGPGLTCLEQVDEKLV